MAQGETTMRLKVDLQCEKCYKKVKKVLCKFPQIRDQVFDEKHNIVTIKVVCCDPENIRDKLCCKGCGVIKIIEIVDPPKPKPVQKPEPTKPKPEQKPEPKRKPEAEPKPEDEPKRPPPRTCCVPCSEGCGRPPPCYCRPPPPRTRCVPCYEGCGRPPPCSCGCSYRRPVCYCYCGGRPCYCVSSCDQYISEECTIM